jgi:SAM-dependent methyltransferase
MKNRLRQIKIFANWYDNSEIGRQIFSQINSKLLPGNTLQFNSYGINHLKSYGNSRNFLINEGKYFIQDPSLICDFTRLPFKTNFFENIIVMHSDINYEFLKEIYRVLKDDGVLIITSLDINFYYVKWLLNKKVVRLDQIMNKSSLTLELIKVGFFIDELEYFNFEDYDNSFLNLVKDIKVAKAFKAKPVINSGLASNTLNKSIN